MSHIGHCFGRVRLAALAGSLCLGVCGCGAAANDAGHTKASASHSSTSAVTSTLSTPAQTGLQSKTSTAHTSTITTATHASSTTHYPQALIDAAYEYVNCMYKHGVAVPPPNFSGHGELIETNAVDTKTPTYEHAASACRDVATAIYNHQLGSGAKKH